MSKIAAAIGALWLAACSSPSGGGGGGSAGCLPNSTQLCWCSATAQGVQSCLESGSGFTACQCGGGTGGADGTAGDSGGQDGAALGAVVGDSSAQDTASQDAGTADQLTGTDTAAIGDTGGSTGDEIDWGDLLDPEDTAVDTGPGGGADNCPERAKIVYVVTEGNQLLSFDPEKLAFKLVGGLKCATKAGETPFSMAVDRKATAWVLYQGFMTGGGVYKVSTLDAGCAQSNYKTGVAGYEVFGMAFSSDAPGITDETLWIGGTKASTFASGGCKLGTLDMKTMVPQVVAPFPAIWGCPDMTGNGQAELYGFFPNANPPAVGKIDKQTAQITKTWPLPANIATTNAWAFAQWGGNLWLFAKTSADVSSNVWALDPQTGVVSKVMTNIGHVIVGAGVSSCAPSGSSGP